MPRRAPGRGWSDGYARPAPATGTALCLPFGCGTWPSCHWLSGQAARSVYTGWVTAKEQLQQLVAEMGEEQASRALGLLKPLLQDQPEKGQAPRLPEFVGSGDSGRSDLSERVDELLAEGFGR
jgi:hypothetical protein